MDENNRMRELEEKIQKLNEAFSSASDGVSEVSKSLREEARMRDKLIEKNVRSSKEEDKRVAAVMMATREYERQMTALGLVKNELGNYQRVTAQLSESQKKSIAQEKQKLAIEEERIKREKAADDIKAKLNMMAADKMQTLVSGLSAFGKGLNNTLLDSTRGQSKYGSVMSSAGDAIMSVTKNLGPFGQAIGLVTGGLFKLVGAAFKQQEQLNRAYESLSEIGAIDVSGIRGMFDNLQKMGFTVSQIEKFGGILKSVGPNLATLGVTTADGAKKIAESMEVVKNSKAEDELRMLGYTSESMAKTFAEYQGMMGRQGFIQGKSTAEISKRSVEYAKTLDQLTSLTGQSRDELQKRMDADANDLKFRLKIQELEKAGKKDEANALRNAGALMREFSEETSSGFREMVAANGAVIGDAAQKLELSTGGAASRITKQLLDGEITYTQAARAIAEAQDKEIQRHKGLLQVSDDVAATLGHSAKNMDAHNKFIGKSDEDIKKMTDDKLKQMSGQNDAERNAEIKRQQTERNLEQAKDRMINLVGKEIVGAFEKLMRMVNEVAKQLAHFLKWLGGPDFTDLFKSADEMVNDLKKTDDEIKEINNNLSKIEKDEDAWEQRGLMQTKKEALLKKKAGQEAALRSATGAPAPGTVENTGAGSASYAAQDPRRLDSATGGTALGGTVATTSEGTEKASPTGSVDSLLNLIGKHESGGDYNILVGGKRANLTEMTVAEVLKFQDTMRARGHETSAVGKYQIIKGTLLGAMRSAGVSMDDKFDSMTQDKLALALLKNRGLEKYQNKKIDAEKFADNLSQEWASLPYKTGKSFYAGVGSNKSSVSRDEVIGSLPKAAIGGLFSGPSSGYSVELHGREAVIPLPNPNSIVKVEDNVNKAPLSSVMANTTTVTEAGPQDMIAGIMSELYDMMSDKLDTMIDKLSSSNDIQDNILKYARA